LDNAGKLTSADGQMKASVMSLLDCSRLSSAKASSMRHFKETLKRRRTVPRTFQPLGDRILVKPSEREEVSRGGIVLPDTAKEKPQEGEIIAIGPGRLTDEGKRVPMDLKKGETVLYAKYGGTEIREDEVDYLLLSERDILAKVTS